MLVLHLLPLLNPWLIIMKPAYVFSIGITLVNFHLNRLSWFHFFTYMEGLLVILIDCMIPLSQLLDVTKMYVSTVSLLIQLGFGIICL